MSPPPRGKSGGDITKSGGDTPNVFARAMRAHIPPRYVPFTFKMPPAPLVYDMFITSLTLQTTVFLLDTWFVQVVIPSS